MKEEGEEVSDLLKLSPEELLKRWFNYHLKNAGHDRRIKNFTSDLKDAVNYTILLNQLNKNIDKSGLDLTDEQRATKVIKDSKTLNVPNTILAKDILSGNDKLNTLFCAEIFNNCPGLTASEEEYNAAKMLDDDIEGSREERSFRMWVNSLGIEDLHINNLYEEFKDGLALLKIIDKVKPGCVDWKKVEKTPSNKFKKLANTKMCVDLCKNELGFDMVNIGGVDIHNGEKKLVLGTMW